MEVWELRGLLGEVGQAADERGGPGTRGAVPGGGPARRKWHGAQSARSSENFQIYTKRDSNVLPAQTCRQANRLGDVVAYVEAAVEKCSALRTAEGLKAVRCSPHAEESHEEGGIFKMVRDNANGLRVS